MVTYIIAAALLSLGLLLFYNRVQFRVRKRKEDVLDAYDRLVREMKMSVEHHDTLNNRIIGLDRRNRRLLLIDHNGKEKQELSVALHQVRSCAILHQKDELNKFIISVILELRFKDENISAVRFYFYNDKHDPERDLLPLARKADKWKNLIDVHKYSGKVYMPSDYVL